MERVDLEQWRAREVARLLTLVETQRRYYQDIVASIPVGLLVLSSDLAIVLANGAARRIFGLRGGDSPHRRLDTILPAWLLDRVEEVLRTGTPQTGILIEEQREVKRRLRVGILAIRNWDDEATQEALLSVEDLSALEMPLALEPSVSAEPVVAVPEPLPAVPEPVAPAPAVSASELIDHLDAVTWAVELPSLNFVFVSPQAEKLLGFPADHWTGNAAAWPERVHEADRDWVSTSYQRAIENGEAHACEFRTVAADGRVLWVRESARALAHGEGEQRYLIGVAVDVTERRMLEDQLVQSERVEAVSRLASRMAHDLNNVLMILTGYGEELLNGIPAGSALRSDVQEILAATERMSGLTGQLLSFARRPGAAAATFELESALGAMSHRLTALLGTQFNLELHLSSEAHGVHADLAQLEQVVTAIVERARQAAPAGGAITMETSHVEITENLRRANAPLQPGSYAVVSIVTPVPPIDGEAKACLFECSLPGKEPWDETAAALSRVYGTVRQWGGDISVSNGPAGASVFRVFLPRVEAPAATPAPPAAVEPPAAAPEPEAPLATILVVEDEAGIRALVRKILRRQGYEVLEAANGQDALALCGDHAAPIDLLITDVLMPQMGGRELVDRLHTQGRNMKVLYVSGYTDDATIYSNELSPGTAFLQKPFTLGSLLDKVKEVLAG
jgi:PAS domain S-box-containing protein